MAIVIKLVSDYAPWIYGACAIVALWYVRVVFLARRERRQSAFTLEREAALNKTYQAANVVIVLVIVMGAVYFVSTSLATAVQPLVDAVISPTPTAFLLPTATTTLEPATPTPTPTAQATQKPTPRPVPTTPAAARTAPAPLVVAPSCPDPRARLVQPGVNQVVNGNVQVFGTASADQFDYYKLEFKPAGLPGEPSYIMSRKQPVINGPLGTWNVGGLPPGMYVLFLRTVDITGNYGECTVQIQVGS